MQSARRKGVGGLSASASGCKLAQAQAQAQAQAAAACCSHNSVAYWPVSESAGRIAGQVAGPRLISMRRSRRVQFLALCQARTRLAVRLLAVSRPKPSRAIPSFCVQTKTARRQLAQTSRVHYRDSFCKCLRLERCQCNYNSRRFVSNHSLQVVN